MPKILILSDDPDNLKLYKLIIEQEGYDCVTATTPQDTLFYLRTSEINVLYMVGLYSFSNFDGLEFYQQLKSDPQLCKIPVIIYTSRIFSDLKPNPADYGDTLFVMPLVIRNLREKLKELTGTGKG
ncbi:MAG: response regulator [Anaerolineales bacterium]|nr:response regulator [Anaerolineales bacterium]